LPGLVEASRPRGVDVPASRIVNVPASRPVGVCCKHSFAVYCQLVQDPLVGPCDDPGSQVRDDAHQPQPLVDAHALQSPAAAQGFVEGVAQRRLLVFQLVQ
jgi:hypothetical protein